MDRHLWKFERTFWLFVKILLYILLLTAFIFILGFENPGLERISRTMGITILTFGIFEWMFLRTYGGYDIGRRKSKPICFSLCFATFFTDIIVYLEVMIMRTNGSSVQEFRLYAPELLLLVMVLQLGIIILFCYGGNGIFFKLHDPENCLIITSDQEHLNKIVETISQLKKQYKIVAACHYRCKNAEEQLRKCDTVFFYNVPADDRAKYMQMAYKFHKNVYIEPEIEDIMEMSSHIYQMDDTVMVNYLSKSLTMEQRIAKRLLDIFLSVFIGVVTLPLVIGAAIAIKIDDGGEIFFRQQRATINGKLFNVLKLRTMKKNDNRGSATIGDDRITKVGNFLRRTRIDEIPQIYNVLRGDMSFVGPRPEMIKNVEMYTESLPEFEYRLRVKAGLTGYAQIAGKYNTTPKDKLVMDMLYIEQFSILLDIQLIFQTVIAVIRPDSSEGFKEHTGGNSLGLELDKQGVYETGH